jgi:hypothetical protein
MAVWTEEQKIVPDGGPVLGGLGWSVAISDDGGTVVAGAIHDGGEGRAYVFVRSGTTWTQQDVLAPAVADAGQRFGFSVALSADGNTAAIGGPGTTSDIPSPGAVWIFVRSAGVWSEQEKLTVTVPSYMQIDPVDGDDEEYNGSNFGLRVALSGDGNLLLVSDTVQASILHSPGDEFKYIDPEQGPPLCDVVYVDSETQRDFGCFYSFIRSGSTWTEDERIEPADGYHTNNTGPSFGAGIDITPDGTKAIIGGPLNAAVAQTAVTFTDPCGNEFQRIEGDEGDEVFYGAWWLSTYGPGWTLDAKELNPTPVNGDLEGRSVAISDDGATRLVGGRRVYAVTDSTFEELTFAESGEQPFEPIALTGDGITAVIGGSGDGGVYVFGNEGGWAIQFGGILVPPDVIGESNEIALGLGVDADSGTRFVFTAPFDDSDNKNGAIWVYSSEAGGEVITGEVSMDQVYWRVGG